MKAYLCILAFCLCALSLPAQEETADISDYGSLAYENEFEKDTTLNYLDADSTWWNALQLGLTFSQSSFSENWTGGGVSSFALNAISGYQLHYQRDVWSWDNQLELLYGIIKNADQAFIRKSQDRIFADTKIGYKISDKWNGFLAANFLSQFAPGYRYEEGPQGETLRFLISRFMAPAFLTTSLGLEYKPTDYFWMRISPFAPRLTFVTADNLQTEEGLNYGVPAGETVREEILAMQLMAELNKNLTENMNLQTRYMLFANYEQLAFNTLDHRLDLLFNARLTRFLNFSAGLIMLYDVDQAENVQISQSMGIGLYFQK